MAILWNVYKWFIPSYWRKPAEQKAVEQSVPQAAKSDTTKAKEHATGAADHVARKVEGAKANAVSTTDHAQPSGQLTASSEQAQESIHSAGLPTMGDTSTAAHHMTDHPETKDKLRHFFHQENRPSFRKQHSKEAGKQ